MAVDPKIISQLSTDLDNLNDVIDDLSKNISANINGGLAVTSESIKKIVEGFEKGDNVTKALTKSLDSASLTNRKLGLEQNSLQARLNALVIANNKGYISGFATKKASLEKQIDENLQQQLLNEKITDYLNKLGNVIETEKKLTEEKKKQGSLSDAFKKKREEILNTYFSEAAIFKVIIDGALRFNKTSVDIGKNLGYGADQANRVAGNIKDIAQSSNDVNISIANLSEAFGQLVESTGFVSEYSADTLKTQVMLTKQFGLTAEEAAGIYQYSVLTGKSSSQVNENMVKAFVAARNQLGVGIPFRATIAEAAKVSGELAANLKNNPSELVKAVAQAKAFGTSLEQVKGQGDKLLDFESSIESQLKAQLLTGESLNLERARAAALTGDQIALAKELSSQGMTLNKFENMNVLAKRAYAEALGLSSDQLADQLKKQQLAIESGKSLAQITADEALEAEKRQNVQEKFNAAILKLQDFFGNLLAGPIGGLLEALTNMLPIIEDIGIAYGIFWTYSKGAALYQMIAKEGLIAQLAKLPALIGLKSAEAAIATETALATTATVEATTFGAATLWIVGGLAAVAGALAGYAAAKAGDMISPADGKTMVSTKEGGLFELSKNDDLLAGPGLAKGGGGGGADLTPMINAINAVKASIDRLYAKEGIVNIDGKRVGTLLTQGSYKTV